MNGQATENRDHRFLTGLVMGGVVGAGLAIWLVPRAVSSARNFGDAVSARYRGARLRVTDAVDELTRTGQGLRDDVCDTVVRAAQDVERGAQDVQQYATDAKTQTVVS